MVQQEKSRHCPIFCNFSRLLAVCDGSQECLVSAVPPVAALLTPNILIGYHGHLNSREQTVKWFHFGGVREAIALICFVLVLLVADALCYQVALPVEIDVQGGMGTLHVGSQIL